MNLAATLLESPPMTTTSKVQSQAPARVREELAVELAARGLRDSSEAVGLAHDVVHRGVEDVEKPLLIGPNRSN